MRSLFQLLGSALLFRRKGDPIKMGFAPYADAACNLLYNLSFCDKLDRFRQQYGAHPQGIWATLLANEPYIAAIKAIAEDQSNESQARALAYSRLRDLKQPLPEGVLLGVVIELASDAGLDVLAAYPDGRVHYIDRTEKQTVFAPAPATWLPKVRRLLSASQAAVERTGPWLQARIAPPTNGMIRMSFLVSDGLYFGQGPLAVMEQDEMAKPIIAASMELLKLAARQDKS